MAVLYFAYGSNMSFERLRGRVQQVKAVSTASLGGRNLVCHKKSTDGSAKCDIPLTGNSSDVVYGVLYEIKESSLSALDRAEGLGKGYGKELVRVIDSSGTEYEAVTYVATSFDTSLKPYSWYMHHVLHGATSHGLPPEYVEKLKAIETMLDNDTTRHENELAIYKALIAEVGHR
jgi:cation transport regulator ChaC